MNFLSSLTKRHKIWIAGILVGIFLIPWGGNKLFEANESGYTLVVQYITGDVVVYAKPGVKPQLFGKTEKYKKEHDYEFRKNIRFNDGGTGTIIGSFRYSLPEDENMVEIIHAVYPSQTALERSLIGKTVDNAIYATGPLVSSTESYAEKRNDLRIYIEDQAKNGIYRVVTKSITELDALTGKDRVAKQAKIMEKDGVYVRADESPISQFGINLYKLSIDSIRYDSEIERQISLQRDALLQIQTAIANAKAAEQDALKAEAQGRKEVAEIEAKKAVEYAQKIQELRIDSAKAAKNREISLIESQTVRTEADAEYYKNQKLVSAGLTPQERALWEYKSDSIWAENIGDIKLPSNYIQSDGKGGASLLEQLTVLQMLKDNKK